MIEQTFGTFRILKQIGEGGMGIVYEAEDLSLGRHVALKFLPPSLSSDPQSLERFKREARSASALNHPNICTIYAVGEQDGQYYMAMELLQGQTLHRKMSHLGRALPNRELVDYAIEIADALDNAHSKGFVHRDIKPANIFITDLNHAKILDFGLAKGATEHQHVAATVGATATHLTSPGTAVGTVAYMSPEQARAEELDARSDLFSFGAVLYEMATGSLPFQGSTSAVIFEAILNRRPVSAVRLNPEVPELLERIIEKALEKDRDLRYQNAAELRADLKRLKRDTDSSHSAAVSIATPKAEDSSAIAERSPSTSSILATEAKRHKFGIAATFMVLVLLTGAAVFGIYSLLGRKSIVPFQKTRVRKITETGDAYLAAISPDGKYVVYAQLRRGARSLWIRHLATNSNVEVIPPAELGFIGITFSPDGDYFYYVRNDENRPGINNLYKAAVLGGTPKKLLEDIDSAVSFSPDGKRIAFRRDSPSVTETAVFVADADGTAARKVGAKRQPGALHGAPAWSPDGKRIAIFGYEISKGNLGSIITLDVDSGAERTLNQSMWEAGNLVWAKDGKGLFGVIADRSTNFQDQVVFISYPSGELHRISNDLNSYSRDSNSIGLTADGKSLLTVAADFRSQLWLVSADGSVEASNAARQLTTANERILNARWTHDNKILTTNRNNEIWLRDGGGNNANAVYAPGFQVDSVTECGPDGSVLFGRMANRNEHNVWLVDRDGGNLHQITFGEDDTSPNCAPDGRWIVFNEAKTGKRVISKVQAAGGNPQTIVELPGGRFSILSPDGKSFAATYNTGEFRRSAGIFSVEDGKLLRQLGTPPRGAVGIARFSPDGKNIVTAIREKGVTNLWMLSVEGGTPKQLTFFDSQDIRDIQDFDFSRDGKQILVVRVQAESDAVLFTEEQ